MHTARMYGSQGVFCVTVYFAYVYISISYVKIVNVNISGVYSGPQRTYRGRVDIGGVYLASQLERTPQL
jgi:hypothetical protein